MTYTIAGGACRSRVPAFGTNLHYDVRVSYIARRPSSRLKGVVERLWRVEDACPTRAVETICPDGCAEIVIHLADPMRGQSRHLLVGQMDAPIDVMPSGCVKMVGARFTPTGLHRLLPMPQNRLVGEVLPLDAVWNAWTRNTADDVASAGNPELELRAFERALESLLPDDEGERPDRAIEMALHAMRARGRPIRLDRLAQASSMSRRQFERRFRDRVGLSPNLYGRIVRFQHAFAALGHESGASVAARLGFADQAHLVREVRRFSGQTPTLLADAGGLTCFFANTITQRGQRGMSADYADYAD
jgi:AraC-like DNA-binding protein